MVCSFKPTLSGKYQSANIQTIDVFLVMLFLLCGAFGPGCKNVNESINDPVQTQTSLAVADNSADMFVRTFQTDSGWGYDIYYLGKRYIHQPHLPAVGGNRAFRSEPTARKVGEAMIEKMKKGIFPPALTPAEVDSLIN